ncbi:hypothetical protein KBZ10_24430 [Streptomyces sp. F63]|uniref:hypothetical protein n=1 Tax=Streptomyces sp. F63 TaxID=2824887 RepID=UPI001B36D728|nr:hypothetical protein [Streptomyces sp. F63]MBQ0987610.1 hypothetical protein [Streptomyces sp. F63]
MPRLLDVSDDVRAEIGDEEADRLLTGENAPGSYDCTSCRTPGDTGQERTSTVLFVGDETAVLAFAHATCVPSQVVPVAEEQLQGAVRSITGGEGRETAAAPPVPAGAGVPGPPAAPDLGPPRGSAPRDPLYDPAPHGLRAVPPAPLADAPGAVARPEPRQAVIGVTSGLVLADGALWPGLVVEPTGPIARPGSDGPGDEFLPILLDQGFQAVNHVEQKPPLLAGWSVLLAEGRLHAVLQPGNGGPQVAWWQAHEPLTVTDGWRTAAARTSKVLVFAAPAGAIGRQSHEDVLREALDRAAAAGVLVAAVLPLAGT